MVEPQPSKLIVRVRFPSPAPNYRGGVPERPKGDVMLYPVDFVADGDLEVVLVIDGFRKTFAITRENVRHSDGTTYGFKAANEYKFNITIDNYVHLDGVTIKTDWPTDSYADEI